MSVKADGAKGLRHSVLKIGQPVLREELVDKTKPFEISKWDVWNAYQRVKANGGGPGVDGQTIEDFETDLKGNLYKIWNRMSSGSYFPPPVKRVEIPKAGGSRPLGIPTVADRIAQTVVKMHLEPVVEPIFHPNSYGYRPGKSALDAVGVARKRCWRYDWVVDLDIRGFFDNLSHALVMRAVRKYTTCKWILLYIERWLIAPVQQADGTLEVREKGTPQGSVVSPLLANVFMHLAFDSWMQEAHPGIPFERYADDAIVHCKNEAQARYILARIEERMSRCQLELHPEKTKIVYCKDDDRRGRYAHEKFDFLGYTFRARRSKNRWGSFFINFLPAVSNKAAKAMRRKMRSWHVGKRSDKSLTDLSRMFNATIRGWINDYGRFYRSELSKVFRPFNRTLGRWAMRKYKGLYRRERRAGHWLGRIARRQPGLFAHWKLLGLRPAAG